MKGLKLTVYVVFLFALAVTLSACDTKIDVLKASGVVEVVEVQVAPEVGGKIIEVYVSAGDAVEEGDSLFRVENDLLTTQYDQGVAGVEAAQANLLMSKAVLSSVEAALESANAGLQLAKIRYELELMAARFQELPLREAAWIQIAPSEFDLPAWYFEKEEEIKAAQVEVEAALESLQFEQASLGDVFENASSANLQEAESRLAEALAAFTVAEELKDRNVAQNGKKEIRDYVQSLHDAAEVELESAQAAFDSLLSEVDDSIILEARARIVVSQERYEIALDQLNQLLTGEESLQVIAAGIAVEQAEALVTQAEAAKIQALASIQLAEKGLLQAEAALDLLDIQVEMLTTSASSSGVVLLRNIEPGEFVQGGITVMTIGQLDKPTITVYIPEDRYGSISLGDVVSVSVDSFPDVVLNAVVTRIADQAEYTPRNVQTAEDRKSTVFAIELSVDDPEGLLKPGMPADVKFEESDE